MSDAAQQKRRERKRGDTAVNGLIAGILAGLVMAAYLVLAGVLSDVPPAVMLGRFDPALEGRWLIGTLAHLAVSSVYGVVFAFLYTAIVHLRPSLLRFGWLLGLAFGLVLFTIARGAMLPVAGSLLLQILIVHLLVAHAIYGIVLGIELSRKW